jgi:DNA invertase Pin-like site-specific DNA recombinase
MMTQRPPRTLDGYVRVSRVAGREGAAYISPDVQKEAIQRWADYRGVTIARWEIDEDQSGGTQDRPGLRRVLERVERGETDGIVVWRLSRFARNVAGALADLERLDAAGGHFASVEEAIDPTGPFGQFVLTTLLAIAKLERDNTVAGWQTAKQRAVLRGAHIGPTPFGYARHDGGEKSGILYPDPVQAPAVKAVYEGRAGGLSLSALAALMDQRAPRENGGAWTTTQVLRILRMRVYLGEVAHGELVNAEAHEALVELGLWTLVQGLKADVRRPTRSELHDFILSGVVRCAACRYAMTGFARGGSKADTPVYRCSKRHGSGICPEPALITAARIEEHVRVRVLEHLRSDRALGVEPDDGPDLAALREEAGALETELSTYLTDPRLRGVLGESDWHQGLEARAVARDDARARLGAAEARASSGRALTVTAEDVEADPGLLRAAVGGALQAVFVRRGRAAVEDRCVLVWADEAEVDLPARGSVVGAFE